ncbi:MAG: Zn-dependent protease [Bdellovibrionaceae bacterium]|nr:Zn-dependent protease [Pseudobdellovibrionaceae bacterium]MBX3034689.1 Zn-dependent protease [Pseudobdellovibrionaceae bacterium]
MTWLKDHFQRLSDDLLSGLPAGEDVVLNLEAEDSLFLRFNANRVRQNTEVEQIVLSLRLQKDGRSTQISRTLSGRFERDRDLGLALLREAREEIRALPADPHLVPLKNHGTSNAEFPGQLPEAAALVESVAATAAGSDLAGIFASGAVVSANRNSRGQNHWFASESFSLDYSLYDGRKAAKGLHAGPRWSEVEWKSNLDRTREQLLVLRRPVVAVKPGRYRSYLAPAAVSEILFTLSWGALSASAWKQGQSPFRKFADGEKTFSPKLHLRENFGLGLAPAFNGFGEVAPTVVNLIEGGERRELLTSSRSAKEFGLSSNAAGDGEAPRSPEILPGRLEEKNALKELGTGLYLSNLHYLNWSDPASARLTGMTRYACCWVENGEIVGPIKDLRFDESLYDAFGPKLIDLTTHAEIDPDVMTYGARQLGGRRVPGMLIDDWTFTL